MTASRHGQEENDDPRNANFSPHLQVNGTNTGVQTSTHENVIHEAPRHANLVPGCDRNEIHSEGHSKTVNHGNGHDVAIVVNDFSETENVVVVQSSSSQHGCVERVEGIAVIREGLIPKRRYRKTFLLIAWHNPREKELIDHEAGIDFPRVCIGACIL